MECVIGITGKDFVLVASDTIQAHSIIVMKQGEIESDLFDLSRLDRFIFHLGLI